MKRKAFLIILDGWGHGENPDSSALIQASTPYIDSLYNKFPNAELLTHGKHVGLPDRQMGNSEVGHLNIGAGRVVYQELARINEEIKNDSLKNNHTITGTIDHALKYQKPIHLLGLLSDGGVHSHIEHLIAICKIFSDQKIKVYLHVFMDGRDTDPKGGNAYLVKLESNINREYCEISTIIGRYYAMDRDKRWDRIKKAYDLLVNGQGHFRDNTSSVFDEFYSKGITDEFMEPIKIGHKENGLIQDGDIVFFTNFRTDRPRQLTQVLSQDDNPEYGMKKLMLYFVTMTEYDSDYHDIKVVFKKENLKNTLGDILAQNKISQLRIAETEKYPHVTFFFSGGREKEFDLESRILINSPKVATYDMKPEMSAYELTNAVHKNIIDHQPGCIIMNYANADMVGHTGVFSAAVKAAETLDACLESLIPVAIQNDYVILIIADHGNSDYMINEDGTPNTAHTTNPVPVIIIDPENIIQKVNSGTLANIAPTILKILSLDVPEEMTAISLY